MSGVCHIISSGNCIEIVSSEFPENPYGSINWIKRLFNGLEVAFEDASEAPVGFYIHTISSCLRAKYHQRYHAHKYVGNEGSCCHQQDKCKAAIG